MIIKFDMFPEIELSEQCKDALKRIHNEQSSMDAYECVAHMVECSSCFLSFIECYLSFLALTDESINVGQNEIISYFDLSDTNLGHVLQKGFEQLNFSST